MVRRSGLLRSVARTTGKTALIAGTATAVSGSVAHRQHQKFAQQSEPVPVSPAPPPPAAAQPPSNVGGSDLVVRLQLLADLRVSGALTEEEFSLAKAKLLHG
jgi:hypothetical protein